jgi:hypothetical protein
MLRHFCDRLLAKDVRVHSKHFNECFITIAHYRSQRFKPTYKLPDENKFWEFYYSLTEKIFLVGTSKDAYCSDSYVYKVV